MVDSISNNNLHLDPLQGAALGNAGAVEKAKLAAANGSDKATDASLQLLDSADVSAAKAKYEAEREVRELATKAFRAPEEFDAGKVGYFKTMLDSGKISDYLRNLSGDALANDLLNSPIAAALAR